MITEVVKLRHINKVIMFEYGFAREGWFEAWFDADQDWEVETKRLIAVKEMPEYQLLDYPNPNFKSIAFTTLSVCVTPAKIENVDIILPTIKHNKSPFSVNGDQYFRLYDYLENNPISKTDFFRLGDPRQLMNISAAAGAVKFYNDDAKKLYTRLKVLFDGWWALLYAAEQIYQMYGNVDKGVKRHEQS